MQVQPAVRQWPRSLARVTKPCVAFRFYLIIDLLPTFVFRHAALQLFRGNVRHVDGTAGEAKWVFHSAIVTLHDAVKGGTKDGSRDLVFYRKPMEDAMGWNKVGSSTHDDYERRTVRNSETGKTERAFGAGKDMSDAKSSRSLGKTDSDGEALKKSKEDLDSTF